jgi:hypothetical protein
MIELPSKVKVGTYTYSVAPVSERLGDDVGDMDTQALTIRVYTKDQSDVQVLGTLLHEILHAIWQTRALPKRPDEERVVENFEHGLVQLFQDNPKLLTLLKKGLK